jgi:NADH-quinone oxidoreductase subunit H
MPDYSIQMLLIDGIKALVVLVVLMAAVAYTTFAERRFAAFFQGRFGPNRAGPLGLLQPLADGIKFLFKEHFVPRFTDRFLYRVAPVISFIPALILVGVIPFGPDLVLGGTTIRLQVADPNFGVLYFFAVASFGVYGVIIAGWSSNNKYSIMGGMRAASMMISYEVSLGLAAVGLFLAAGSVHLSTIVGQQESLGNWFIWRQPLGFLLFTVASFAETHRVPFDLPEAEQELVGGYQTEYGGMQLGLFQMGEYAHMIAASALMVVLYLGGWHFPLLERLSGSPYLYAAAGAFVMVAKTAAVVFFFIWVRWTIPRFRFDQLMRLGWKALLPLALINVLVTAVLILLKGT